MSGWRYYSVEMLLILVLGLAVAYFGYLGYGLFTPTEEPFSGERAEFYVAQQLQFGNRISGSAAGYRTADWLVEELTKDREGRPGWDVVVQPHATGEIELAQNIVAIRGDGPQAGPVVILSTHYDTRAFADRDPEEEMRLQPSPGANVGGSGTAVLLELARTLDLEATGHTVCLVFFDAETNGGLPTWEYAMGSKVFVERLEADVPRCSSPRVAVHLDSVGGQNAKIAAIAPNAQPLVDVIRRTARELGYQEAFRGPHMREDVDALSYYNAAGIPAVMLADLAYSQRYTTSDVLPRISAQTLQQVGSVLKAWLEDGARF